MPKPLQLLLIEDSDDDAELLLCEFRRNGYQASITRVQTEGELISALATPGWDLIISDYNLPAFSGPQALSIIKERGIDVPFIFVSGVVGEERAVCMLKAGASDFISKGALSRLMPAVERELNDVLERQARRKADETLQRFVIESHDFFDNAPCGYHSLDANGIFVRINDTELNWLGYKRHELLGVKRFSEVLAPDSVNAFKSSFDHFKAHGSVRDLEYNMVRKDGSLFPALLNATAVTDSKGNYVMSRSIVFDNTERKRLEEQLRQSQKMEAIGQLAGGVAHDFNNLLTVIIGHSMLALERLDPDAPTRNSLTLIHKTGERAAALTRQLLAFSRHQVLEPKILDLNMILVEIDEMLRRLVPENMELSMNLAPALRPVNADQNQIEQVAMNLVINARDAIQTHGRIIIETANVELDEAYARTHVGVKPGRYVLLAISDTGCGMPENIKAHIFEPFFTTKERGKGTGLGLSTVYGIVKQSGGTIEVYSETGKGSTFKVYLPSTAAALSPQQSSQALPQVSAGNEVVLVVEDDAEVRELVLEILRVHKYVALSAVNGVEALAVANAFSGHIHLLMTDMVMPVMTGPVLAERLQHSRPNTRVLFMSGYTERAIVNNGMLAANTYFLHKPFTPASVARKIRETLDAPVTERSPSVPS